MKKMLFALILLSLILSACGQLGLEGQVIAPTAPPTVTVPPVVPTSTPEPLPTTVPNVLPAPLHFISVRNNQIWRIERDGVTATQITREAFDIDSFDISPVDGALVYVTNNTLYRADANGDNRVVLVNGPFIDAQDYKAQWEQKIREPRWRPDGKEIFFGQGGINFMMADGSDGPHLIVPASAYPENLTSRLPEARVNYWPYSFSPDGTFLLVLKQYYPEGISPVLIRLNSGAPPQELATDGYGTNCCSLTWSADSQSLYASNPSAMVYGLDFVGVWKASVAEGLFKPFLRGYPGDLSQPVPADATYTSISFVFEANGQLYAFANERKVNEDPIQPDTLGLARINPNGTVTPISAEKYQTIETLGARDGSGAVLIDTADWNYAGPYPLGQLRWLPSDGGPAVDLVEKGSQLRWGK